MACKGSAWIDLAMPGRPIGPWLRRNPAPEASATGRDRPFVLSLEGVMGLQGLGVLSKCTRCPVRSTRCSGSLTWPTRVASRS
jgi:hypothetical protein